METKPWNFYHQRILNAHEVPPHSAQVDLHPCVPVRARIVWEKDGVEYMETTAYAYSGRLILVHTNDRRNHGTGVWLSVEDALRLGPQD